MDKFPRMGLIFLLLATLAGCGAKGPLFLPEKPASQEIPEDKAKAPADEADSADQQAEDAAKDPVSPAVND